MPDSRSTRWCFTANNFDAGTVERLSTLVVVYIVYGEEVAPTTGTLHLQGFCILPNARSLRSLSTELPGVHLERARGTSQQAADYCRKGTNVVERGVLPVNGGKRNDIDRILEWLDHFILVNGRPPTDRETVHEQPTAYLRYRNFSEFARLRAPSVELRFGQPREWQVELSDILLSDADDRTIRFYIDPDGGKGKTWFQQWFYTAHGDITQLLGDGRIQDMCFAIDCSKTVFLINVARDRMQFLQYSVLEQLKDRMVFSSKYSSQMKVLSRNVHVVVFCNEDIDHTKLTADRVVITNLSTRYYSIFN